jgi:hypothetical protein
VRCESTSSSRFLKGVTRRAILSGFTALSAFRDAGKAQSRKETGRSAAPERAMLVPLPNTKTKLFDPKDGFGAITNIRAFTDATVFNRGNRGLGNPWLGNQWWMIAGGFNIRKGAIVLLSASLPPGAALSAKGWKITTAPDDPTAALEVVAPSPKGSWDGAGGLHCPAYVRGWDPAANGGAGAWQERIYYAGSAASFAGPYAIGYLEWTGSQWERHGGSPVFTATEPWEGASVAEPNVIYQDGKWRMWYFAGDFVQGYAESADGRTNWKKLIAWPAEQKIFDHAVMAANGRFEGIFARYPLTARQLAPDDGLWWHRANNPYPEPGRWSAPAQILSPLDGQADWHAGGIWKPSFQYSDEDPARAFVFFDGCYAGANPFPVYTMGCIECALRSVDR